MRVRLPAVVLAWSLTMVSAWAQPREPIGPFVVDVRVVSSGLPTEPGWTPTVPASTVLPSRGLGVDLGAHVYVLRFRRMAIGAGIAWITARAATAPAARTSTGTTPVVPTIPDMTTRVRTLAPQLSINFGHRLGWSYLSAGLGRSAVVSEASLATAVPQFAERESTGVKTLNFGGGARWFINDHVGIGLDLRWHKLSLVPATATHPGAGRASMLVAGGGVVLK